MRIETASIALAIVLAAQLAYSADVAYQLNTESLPANEPTKTTKPTLLTIVNREWAVPGVEQSETELPPAREFDFDKRPYVRFEVVGRGYSTTIPGPHWLDDVAWPRTRAWFQQEEIRFSTLLSLNFVH
jgi:hypothetical protein